MKRFMCFSSSFVRDFAKNIARKLANITSYQNSNVSLGGPNPRRGVNIRGGPNPL